MRKRFGDAAKMRYLCALFQNLCHDLAQPSCTFAEKIDNIWLTTIEGKA